LFGSAVAVEIDRARLERAAEVCKQHIGTYEIGESSTGLPANLQDADLRFRDRLHGQILKALSASPSADDQTLALYLSRIHTADETSTYSASPDRGQAELDRLEEILKIDPNNVRALVWAQENCLRQANHPLCGTNVTQRLLSIEPDNGVFWLARLSELEESDTGPEALEALSKLPEADFRHRWYEMPWAAHNAILAQWPDIGREERKAMAVSFFGLAASLPLPSYQGLYQMCGPEALLKHGENREKDCLKVSRQMISQDQYIDVMFGLLIQDYVVETRGGVDRSERIVEIGEWRLAERADMENAGGLYYCDIADLMDPKTDIVGWEWILKDLAEVGEREAHQRQLQRHLERWAPEVPGKAKH
jgi:hypothetical protein